MSKKTDKLLRELKKPNGPMRKLFDERLRALDEKMKSEDSNHSDRAYVAYNGLTCGQSLRGNHI